ncbi:hypothetical protein GCM10028773_40800 [Spirosoma koreense]
MKRKRFAKHKQPSSYKETELDGNKKWQTNVSPLRPPTLASVKTWGIQQELVAPICRCKVTQLFIKRPNFTRTFV